MIVIITKYNYKSHIEWLSNIYADVFVAANKFFDSDEMFDLYDSIKNCDNKYYNDKYFRKLISNALHLHNILMFNKKFIFNAISSYTLKKVDELPKNYPVIYDIIKGIEKT